MKWNAIHQNRLFVNKHTTAFPVRLNHSKMFQFIRTKTVCYDNEEDAASTECFQNYQVE